VSTVNLSLALVQSAATLVALVFAWKTVKQGTASSRELAEERHWRTLENVIELVSELRFAIMNGNGMLARPMQARLRALLPLLTSDLPKCRALANVSLERNPEDFVTAQVTAEEALTELGATPFGH
jgi:hypothetical protein